MEKEKISVPDLPFTDEIIFTTTLILPENIVAIKPKNLSNSINQNKVNQSFKLIDIMSGKANTKIATTGRKSEGKGNSFSGRPF